MQWTEGKPRVHCSYLARIEISAIFAELRCSSTDRQGSTTCTSFRFRMDMDHSDRFSFPYEKELLPFQFRTRVCWVAQRLNVQPQAREQTVENGNQAARG